MLEELKQRILTEGRAKAEGGIVLVGSFLNHQLDPQLMMRASPKSSPKGKDFPLPSGRGWG